MYVFMCVCDATFVLYFFMANPNATAYTDCSARSSSLYHIIISESKTNQLLRINLSLLCKQCKYVHIEQYSKLWIVQIRTQ